MKCSCCVDATQEKDIALGSFSFFHGTAPASGPASSSPSPAPTEAVAKDPVAAFAQANDID